MKDIADPKTDLGRSPNPALHVRGGLGGLTERLEIANVTSRRRVDGVRALAHGVSHQIPGCAASPGITPPLFHALHPEGVTSR